MNREINQRRAVSVLVLLGSILLMVVTWNYSSPESNRWQRAAEE
jgi:hypothetical protein